MTTRKRRGGTTVAAVVMVLSISTIGCRDSTAPPSGTIDVTVKSTGSDVDPDGYVVTVDARLTRHVEANTTTTFAGIAPGDHSVSLGNLATNCTVSDANPRGVTVVAEASVTAEFPVACISRTGSVRLTINTTGSGLDPDGYRLRVDDAPERAVATNDVLVLVDLHEGSHTLSLGGVASNCTVGSSGASVNVRFGDTTPFQLAVTCVGKGTLKITAVTTGLNLDPDGYTLNVYSSDYYGPYYTTAMPTNGTASLPDIVAGEYTLSIDGRAPNCQWVSSDPSVIVIEHSAVTSASLNLVCFGKGTLSITAATTGIDLDPDGYTINLHSYVDNSSTRSVTVPTNGTVSVSDILGGPYGLVARGWAPNCDVAGSSHYDLVVDDKGPTSVKLNVSCAQVSRLAYVVTESGHSDIYSISANGTGPTRLTTNAAADEDPAWSPDGSTVAFATNRDGAYRIYLMNADGSNQRPVSTAGAVARQPAWSPDGQKIAFVGNAANGDPEIYVMKADGTDLQRLTQSVGDDDDPAWSPDGTKIAFRSNRTGGPELYVMDADGSNVTRLTTTALDEAKPSWSPDGSKIVFAAGSCDYYYGCYSDLFVMNADGTRVSQLTQGSISSSPAWSPDGAWVAFVITECSSGCDSRISMVKADGTGGGTIVESHASQPAWRRR